MSKPCLSAAPFSLPPRTKWGEPGWAFTFTQLLSLPEGMTSWCIDSNGGDQWNVETLPGACGTDFPSSKVRNYFVTSYE